MAHITDASFWTALKAFPEIYNVHRSAFLARQDGTPMPVMNLRDHPLVIGKYDTYEANRLTVTNFTGAPNGVDITSWMHGRNHLWHMAARSMAEIKIIIDSFIGPILERIPGLVLAGGAIYSLITGHWVNDYDLFLIKAPSEIELEIEPEHAEKLAWGAVKGLLNVIAEEQTIHRIIDTSHALTIMVKDTRQCIRKIQVIKRVYKTAAEIISGFDVDASCAYAAWSHATGAVEVAYNARFALAMEFGINVVNPFYASTTYNQRLIKYYRRGFDIFVPVNIGDIKFLKERIGVLMIDQIPKPHTLANLLCRFYYYRYSGTKIMMARQLPADYEQGKYTFRTIFRSSPSTKCKEPKAIDFETLVKKIKKGRYLGKKYYSEASSQQLADLMHDEGLFRDWRIREPGSQIHGAFNPTDQEYYGSLSDVRIECLQVINGVVNNWPMPTRIGY